MEEKKKKEMESVALNGSPHAIHSYALVQAQRILHRASYLIRF